VTYRVLSRAKASDFDKRINFVGLDYNGRRQRLTHVPPDSLWNILQLNELYSSSIGFSLPASRNYRSCQLISLRSFLLLEFIHQSLFQCSDVTHAHELAKDDSSFTIRREAAKLRPQGQSSTNTAESQNGTLRTTLGLFF
jgi:hypothetical protein